MSFKVKNTKSQFLQAIKYVLIAAVVTFISLLFPSQASFKYDVQPGQIWNYEELSSPFDYPIKKSRQNILQEEAEIKSKFIPYYSLTDPIESASPILRSAEIFLGPDSIRILEGYLQGLLRQPITEGKEYIFQNRVHDKIKIFQDNRSTTYSISQLQTESQIRTQLANWMRLQFGLGDTESSNIENSLVSNISLNQTLSQDFLNEELSEISVNTGLVRTGELIINKGAVVNQEAYQKIQSLKSAYNEKSIGPNKTASLFAGYLLLTILLMGVLLIYLRVQFPSIFEKLSSLSFIFLWIVVMSYLVYVIENRSNLSSYLIPFCIVPLIVKNFFNDRLALFVHIVIVLIASFLSELGYEFTFLQILAGIVAILLVSETRYWNKFFAAIVFIFLAYALGFTGLSLIKGTSFANFEWNTYAWLGLNALLTLLAYPFIPLLERLFGFTSSITLAELSDMNRPLLKDLSLKAPGTLQHSLQVANLSEAAADKIGANSLLVKVASLYHDIGKLIHPEYFIENQKGTNPHESISNFESAKKIIDHVSEGAKMAQKAKLPKMIIDFIWSHHGTTRVEYFLRNQSSQFPDQEFDESLFEYPGPKPKSKEEAIVMMADSIEASSKSLKNPSGQDIDNLVDKIIDGKIDASQLDDCDLSFKELESCKETFKSLLRSIYHVRVEYPDAKEETGIAKAEEE